MLVPTDYPNESAIFSLRVKWRFERTAANDEHIRVSVLVACPLALAYTSRMRAVAEHGGGSERVLR